MQGFIEKGVGILPARVRMGDSHNISLDLTLNDKYKKACKKEGYIYEDYLEAELQAVELKVAGKERLRICETSPLLITGWICNFPTSGLHTMNLMINVVKHNNLRDLIFMQKHAVKVESFLGISFGPVLALATPILVTVVQFLLKIGAS